jgi:hypothetical protein
VIKPHKTMKTYTEHICPDCLMMLCNGESDHTKEELKHMEETLEKWATDDYVPGGLTENTEPFFEYSNCILCHSLPGDRYEYYFLWK